MAFQQTVGIYRGVGQVGHPASTSPIIAAAGGPGAFKAATAGVSIATFVFRDAADPKIVTNVAPAADSKPTYGELEQERYGLAMRWLCKGA